MNDNFFRWVLFLINPFFSMIISFKEYTVPYSKNILWAFCVFYGLTFAIGSESVNNDIVRYVAELHFLYSQGEFSSFEIMQYFITSGELDILRIFLNYFVSRFTDSQAVLTTIYGFVFGFFFSRNVWYVLAHLKKRLSFLEKFILFAFILVVPIWFLGGFRMWTAFHIFMYGLLPYIFENNRKKLFFIFLSILVHFSYLIPVSMVLVYLLLGNRIKLYFLIFIISIFITDLNISLVNQFVENYLPEALDIRSSSYRSEESVNEIRENFENDSRVWYVSWYKKSLNWALIFLMCYFFIKGNPRIKYLLEWRKLFSLTLIFYSLANILSSLPSGIRFLSFSFFLSLIMIVLYLNQFRNDYKFRNIIIFLTPVFLLFIIISIRMSLYNTSISTIIGNPFLAIFTAGDTISLNDLIK